MKYAVQSVAFSVFMSSCSCDPCRTYLQLPKDISYPSVLTPHISCLCQPWVTTVFCVSVDLSVLEISFYLDSDNVQSLWLISLIEYSGFCLFLFLLFIYITTLIVSFFFNCGVYSILCNTSCNLLFIYLAMLGLKPVPFPGIVASCSLPLLPASRGASLSTPSPVCLELSFGYSIALAWI